jgi:hypothetical protein
VHGLVESRGSLGWRCTSNGLSQVYMGLSVIQLNSFDTTEVIMVASKLGVTGRSRKGGLGYKFVGLII